jgi:hypothetical protein
MADQAEPLTVVPPAQTRLVARPRTGWLVLASGFFGWLFGSIETPIKEEDL